MSLLSQGEPVGTLVVGQRGPRETLTPAELRLFDELGRQVAIAARSVLLARGLQLSRERLVTTREEERRRIRRDLQLLRVSDDGIGIPPQRKPGVGLAAMAEGAAELGGKCHIRARPAGGTDVVTRLPLGVT